MNVNSQAKIIFEYMRLFFKITISNKITFVWYLLLPIAIFFISRYTWISSPPSLNEFYFQVSVFIAYIVFVLSIDASVNLIRLRESGSMKVFKFISGSKYTVIWAQIFNQIITMLLALILFSTVIGILFIKHPMSILLFILICIIVCILVSPAISLFFLWLMLLPIKQESLITILNIILLLFFLISANNLEFTNSLWILTFLINPLEVVRETVFWITNLIINTSITTHSIFLILSIFFVYIIVGAFSMYFAKIVSQTQRT